MKVMKKFAVFDIDGTLYRWQLYYSIVFELRKQGAFSEKVARDIDEQYRKWQGKEASWADFSKPVVDAFLKNLGSIDVDEYRKACETVMQNESHKVYAYTLNLLRQLKKDGYTLVAITGSQHDIAQPFADKYGFDYCYGEVYSTVEGKFSGDVALVYNRKDEIVHKFLQEHPDHSLKGSVGIGDSHWDEKMLRLVERPIAFNPDEGLFAIAKERGWSIVIERKNIAYRLEKHDNELVLADTTAY